MPESLWTRVADLPLTVDAHEINRLEAPARAERVTYLVRLRGGGAEGLGEDVGGDMLDEKGAFLAAAASLALAGRARRHGRRAADPGRIAAEPVRDRAARRIRQSVAPMSSRARHCLY